MRTVLRFVLGMSLLASAGCGAEMERGGIAIPEFPDAEDIERIKDGPLPPEQEIFADVGVELERWELEGPLPWQTSTKDSKGSNVASRVLGESIHAYGHGARATEGMTCVAHQVGRLVLAHGDAPSSTLLGFILARCGAAVGSVELRTWNTERGRLDDAAAEPMIEEALRRPPRDLGGHPDSVLGAWYGGTDQESLLVLAHGRARLELEPLSMDARGLPYVTIQGTKPRGVELVTGVVTSGESGFAECRMAEGEAEEGPGFTLRCPVLATDSATLVDLIEHRRRRVLGTKALTLFVSPDGTMPATYQEPRVTSLAAVDASSPDQIAETINGLRSLHGLAPVVLEAAQSREVAEVLPYFMAAANDDAQAEVADAIMMHVIAGRSVESAIRDAQALHFATTTKAGEGVDRAIVRETLSPMVRSTLLDPKAQRIAVGVRTNTAASVAAVMLATYDQPDVHAYPELEQALYEQLDRERAERGLPPVVRARGAAPNALLDQAMGKLELGADLGGTLGHVLERLSSVHPEHEVGYAVEGIEPEGATVVDWPEPLLRSEEALVMLRVGQYAVLGSRWVVELAVVLYVVPSVAPADY